ncbi:MAG: electron transfer flavoprotein subunit alpha/FixB family protein [Candidatus Gastranaerophilales bacterium]|nr:electron transfer flavoprotein subunit alpha/FixB family protein [Candidatus Gastranaerophilales bacterium]
MTADNFKIAVFCEMMKNGYPNKVSLQLVSKAVSMAENIDNAKVMVIIIGKRMFYDPVINEISSCGADKIIIANDDVLKEFSSERYKIALTEILKREKPEVVLFGATVFGRELAPLVATALKTGLTADCTALNITKDGILEATRPTYDGKMKAVIVCKTLPQMATVRPNVFKVSYKNSQKDTKVLFDWIDTNSDKNLPKLLETLPFPKSSGNTLENAKIIFAGGKGLKNSDNFKKLYELAKLAGAEVGASRGAVDAGLAPADIQIGQTGKTVAPKLYIAFGISGMAQHLAGINSCDKIIAVNNDAEAPVFNVANVGIIGDAAEIIEKMTDKLYKRLEIENDR